MPKWQAGVLPFGSGSVNSVLSPLNQSMQNDTYLLAAVNKSKLTIHLNVVSCPTFALLQPALIAMYSHAGLILHKPQKAVVVIVLSGCTSYCSPIRATALSTRHVGTVNQKPPKREKTSTSLYRSCAALTSFSGTFDLILFQAVNFEFNVAYSTDTQKINNYLILI